MVRLDTEQARILGKSKTYEEFLVNKDLLGFKGKKFGQNDSFEILKWMALFSKDSALACKIVEEAKHITIGYTLLERLYDNIYGYIYGYAIASSKNAKQNAFDIYHAVHAWFTKH